MTLSQMDIDAPPQIDAIAWHRVLAVDIGPSDIAESGNCARLHFEGGVVFLAHWVTYKEAVARMGKKSECEVDYLKSEVEVGEAFHRVAVQQRDAAWAEIEGLKKQLANAEQLRDTYQTERVELRAKVQELELAFYRKVDTATNGELENLRSSAERLVKERKHWQDEAVLQRELTDKCAKERDKAREDLSKARDDIYAEVVAPLVKERDEWKASAEGRMFGALDKVTKERDEWKAAAEGWRVNVEELHKRMDREVETVSQERDEWKAAAARDHAQVVSVLERDRDEWRRVAEEVRKECDKLRVRLADDCHELHVKNNALITDRDYWKEEAKRQHDSAIKFLNERDQAEQSVKHWHQIATKTRAERDAERASKLANLRESYTEADLLDLLRKFAAGTGGRRTGELMRRGWITVGVTYEGCGALGAENYHPTGELPGEGPCGCIICVAKRKDAAKVIAKQARFIGPPILIQQVNEYGINTGRPRFQVFCQACHEEIHEATTGVETRAQNHAVDCKAWPATSRAARQEKP